MARLSPLVFSAIALSSLAGCALVLGSFTNDGVVSGDGGSDARVDGATDGGDGAVPPKVLGCSLDGVQHKIVSNVDIADQPLAVHTVNGNSDARRIAYMFAPSGKSRRVEVDDTKSDGSNVTALTNALSNDNEYIGFDSFEGGFAFLGYSSGTSSLNGSFLLDKDNVPAVQQVIPLNPPLPSSPSNFSAAIVPLDLQNGIFFVVVSFSTNNQAQQDMYAGSVKLTTNSPPLEKIQTFAKRPDFSSSGLVLDRVARKAALVIGADQGLGDSQVLNIDFNGAATAAGMRPLPGLNGTHVLGSFSAPSVPMGGANGLGLLTGDLVKQGVQFGMHAGTLPDDKTKSFLITDLPPLVPFDSIDDLAADKSSFEWRFFSVAGPQLLIAARKTGTGDGVNLLWFDAKGNLRAKASGATALVPGEKVSGANATFRNPPTGVFTQLSVMWRNEAHDIMLADVTCK